MINKNTNNNFIINPSLKMSMNIKTEIRGFGKIEANIDVLHDKYLAHLLIELVQLNQQNITIPEKYINSFIKTAVLIKASQIPNNIKFKCKLDENNLLPIHRIDKKSKNNLILNKDILLQETDQLPDIFKSFEEYAGCLSPDLPIAWVKSAKSKNYMPFWLEQTEKEIIKKLFNNQIDINNLDKEFKNKLLNSEIILSNNSLQNISLNEEKDFLKNNEYLVIKNLLNPLQISALRNYFRELDNKGFFIKGDHQVKKRDSMPNEPTIMFFHRQFTDLISNITDSKVKPTFCFVAIYHPGSILKKHTDREQCLWNISLVIDMQPEQNIEDSWSIFLETKNGTAEVKLGLGDAVLYKGTETPHWRTRLKDDQKYTILFLHFVSDDFQGSII